ncbi:hypothetical protein DFH27DRAFT_530258 [Peziza echinospora]|nr:hypothetical protein DFH27DRAFT_530258 [Peziza echinospora]
MGNSKLKRRTKIMNEAPDRFELPPTSVATNSHHKRRKPNTGFAGADDTPKEFLRMMSGARRGRGGMEDTGVKKKNNPAAENPNQTKKPSETATLKIQPNESLRQFGRRVDSMVPMKLGRKGVAHHSHEKKLRKLKAAGEKLKEGESADVNDSDISEEDLDDNGNPIPGGVRSSSRKRKRGSAGSAKKRNEISPDPFANVGKTALSKFSVAAPPPPKLAVPRNLLRNKVPKNFVRGDTDDEDEDGAKKVREEEYETWGRVDLKRDVPKASGSSTRRELLGEERMGIVERYRELMSGKRAAAAAEAAASRAGGKVASS